MTDADAIDSPPPPSPPPAKQPRLEGDSSSTTANAAATTTAADTEIGSLRTEAQRRKERLVQMRRAAMNKGLPAGSPASGGFPGEEGDDNLPKPIFRNYKPISEDLKEGQLLEGAMIDLDVHVSEQLEAAKAQAVVDEVNLFNLAPRKPDWDLKRGVEKKLKKLERRTQRAISEIIRERLQAAEDSAVSSSPTLA